MRSLFFFFNDTATTEIYTLSLHDALPISSQSSSNFRIRLVAGGRRRSTFSLRPDAPMGSTTRDDPDADRSEEHTSELQSRSDLVCRLLLEKKKKNLRVHLL